VWFVNQIMPFTICPICAGVSLTWAWLIVAHFMGYQVVMTIPALLMGGSVVGIAFQLEKKSGDSSPGARILWKMFFIPAGFIAAYAVLEQWWVVFLFAIAFLVVISFWFLSLRKAASAGETVKGIEKEMKDCC